MTNSNKNNDTLTNSAASQEGALISAIVILVCLPMYDFVYYTGMNGQIWCTGGLPDFFLTRLVDVMYQVHHG